jgi:hypothetical protein
LEESLTLVGNEERVQKALAGQNRQILLQTYAKEALGVNKVMLGAALAVLGA